MTNFAKEEFNNSLIFEYNMIQDIPDLLKNYLAFCDYLNETKKSNSFNPKTCSCIYPTTFLPLIVFKVHEYPINVSNCEDRVINYVRFMFDNIGKKIVSTKSYLPPTILPKEENLRKDVLENLYQTHNDGVEYCGMDSFCYLINELVDNIYDHSKFSNAGVMVQKYKSNGFTEICICDNGVTIPGSFNNNEILFKDDCDAIKKAINGRSSRSEERGFGLNTNLRLFTTGLNGKMLIVSRNGAYYSEKKTKRLYNLPEIYSLRGTLISVRIPYPCQGVDIYEFIK